GALGDGPRAADGLVPSQRVGGPRSRVVELLVLGRQRLGLDDHLRGGGIPADAERARAELLLDVIERIVVDELDGRAGGDAVAVPFDRSEEHTSELQSRENLVCRLLLEKKKKEE